METTNEQLNNPFGLWGLSSAELAAKLREHAGNPNEPPRGELEELLRVAAAVLLTTDNKVAAWDAARAVVKTEGNSRAYYVLRAEFAEERVRQLEAALDKVPMPSHDQPVGFWDAWEARCELLGDT